MTYERGDLVVFTKRKDSRSPGPRARQIEPSPNGDEYTYLVDKYWRVDEVLPNGRLRLVTRTGKQHTIPADMPNLRRARWIERIFLKGRFPAEAVLDPDAGSLAAG